MGKLVPIILIAVGFGAGVGAGLVLRPANEMVGMAECDATSASDTATVPAHGEPAADTHGTAEPTADPHGAAATSHDEDESIASDCASSTNSPTMATAEGGGHGEDVADLQYAKLNKQFVVPVVTDGRVSSLVVMSLSVEVDASMLDAIYTTEPKLRDAFLSVMFLHANSGGFNGEFTRGEPMSDLRGSLREAAQNIIGPAVTDVLITEIVRQDV